MSTRDQHILVIGRNGQVGWELMRTLAPLGTVTGLDYPELNLLDPASIEAAVQRLRPTVIVNAAAYTAVDKAETEPDLAQAINATAPGLLAAQARQLNALLVHYSTDYVFDGSKKTPYVETDAPNPLGVYGRTKLAGDQAVQKADGDHVILRLCWVYGSRGKNFMLTMQKLARERDSLRVVHDQFGCPTWCRLIAEATAHVVARRLRTPDDPSLNGVYHLASSGQTSWHGFAEAIINSMPESDRQCRTIDGIPTCDYPTPAKRPAFSVLSCQKLQDTFGLNLPDWRTSLAQAMEPTE